MANCRLREPDPWQISGFPWVEPSSLGLAHGLQRAFFEARTRAHEIFTKQPDFSLAKWPCFSILKIPAESSRKILISEFSSVIFRNFVCNLQTEIRVQRGYPCRRDFGLLEFFKTFKCSLQHSLLSSQILLNGLLAFSQTPRSFDLQRP
jgi:hypothetical protein